MRRTLTPCLVATLAVLALAAAACRGSGDGYDEATRSSVFADLDVTLRRYLAVPSSYALTAFAEDAPALAARDRANELIGNGLGTTDLRLVEHKGVEVGVLQVTVFSALAPDGSVDSLLAGFAEANGPSVAEAVGGQAVQRFGDGEVSYVWRTTRVVVSISGAQTPELQRFVEAYLKGKNSGG